MKNRLLLIAATAALLLAGAVVAEARSTRQYARPPIPNPQRIIPQSELPTKYVDLMRRFTFGRYGMGGVMDSCVFVPFDDNGETRNVLQQVSGLTGFAKVDACDYSTFSAGAASSREHARNPTSSRANDLDNSSLCYARGSAVMAALGNPGEPYPQAIRDYRPGAFIVRVYFPPDGEVAKKDTVVVIAKEVYTETIRETPMFWVRPSIGGAGAWLKEQRVLTPYIGVVAGSHFGKYSVAAYGAQGQDFQAPNRGTASGGIQFGDEDGLSIRFGYRSTWTEIRGDGHTTQRAEGAEVGLGYGFPAFRVGIDAAVLQYADLIHRGGSYKPALTATFDLGPIFRVK